MVEPRESSDASIREFLAAVSAGDATHGPVSAAALAGGLGASLLQMVSALPQTRSDSPTDRAKLAAASTALSDLQQQLLDTIETKTVVKIYAARNMPQASASQRTEREEAIQVALRAAADVPLEVVRLCALALGHARTVAACCSRAATTDVEFAIGLLNAGLSGARSNLETRLRSLTDVAYTTALVEEMAQLSETGARDAKDAEASVRIPPS